MSSPDAPVGNSPNLCPAVLGQELARTALARAMASGRMAHAYLLAGPEGVGKRLFADELGRALLCPRGGWGSGRPNEVGACGLCSSCVLPPESHPGLRVLETPSGGAIDIAGIREAIQSLSLRAGGRRCIILDGADSMAPPAANALLKTLEEPPPGIIFLLVSSRPAHLLETIISRTQRVPFAPLSPEQFGIALARRGEGEAPSGGGGVSPEVLHLHRIAGGAPGVAVRLLAGITACGGRERFLALLSGVGAENPSSLVEYLPALPKETVRARVHRLLELVQCGLWGERAEDPRLRQETGERALLVGELIRGLAGGRSTELTLELLARILRNAEAERVTRRLPRSFFAGG